MYNFELYKPQKGRPKNNFYGLTYHQKGSMYLSTLLSSDIENWNRVVIFYDRDAQVFALQKSENEKGAIQRRGGRIGTKSRTLNCSGIKDKMPAGRYSYKETLEDGKMVFVKE